MARFNENTTFAEVLDTPEGLEIAKKHLGALVERQSVEMLKGRPLGELKNMIPLPPSRKNLRV